MTILTGFSLICLRATMFSYWSGTGRARLKMDFHYDSKIRESEKIEMAKSAKKLKKANHGKRPASAKARKAKRKHIKT